MMEMTEGKQGLWANIHAKRKRIKAGSGERMRKPGSKGAPTDADFKAASKNEAVEVKDTDDYKLSSSGRKVKAHKIVFNKGEDDGKKGVSEQMRKSYDQFVQEHTPDLTEEQLDELVAELQEVLGKDDPAGEWISDFVHSDNPKFAGKSKEKRKQMALAAYYAKQRDESVVPEYDDPISRMRKKENEEKRKKGNMKEELKGNQHKLDKNKNGKLDKHDFKLLRKEDAEQIDELSKDTLTSYAHKAGKALGGHIVTMGKSKEIAKSAANKVDAKKLKALHTDLARRRMFGLGNAAKRLAKEEVEQVDEAESHQAKTTMKHVKNPTAGEKKAAKDIKPGIKGYRDRVAMLHSADAEGRLKKEETEQVDEAWPGTPEYKKKFPDTDRTTGTGARHDIKKTATGVIATRRYAADDTTEKPKDAPKRGRGRPKKDKFAEAVEFLMALDEQQFNELTSEGFDAFFESFLTVVESK